MCRGLQNNLLNKGNDHFQSEVIKDVGMFVSVDMFTDASGEVSNRFINITGATAFT